MRRRRRRKIVVFVVFVVVLLLGGRWVYREMQFTNLRLPLIEAVQTNYTAEVRSLLEQGADPNVRLDYKPEPFSWQRVLRLFRLGSPPPPPPDRETVLIDAASRDRDDIVGLLLEHGADPNACDNSFRRWTALHCAAHYGAIDSVNVLLTHGADVNARNESGETPLFEAVSRDEAAQGYHLGQNCIGLLLEHGADVNARAHSGETPLLRAARFLRYDSWLQLLLAHGADVNASASDGHTALMLAATWGRPEGVEMLLAAGARIDAQDDQGCTALAYALRTMNEKKDLLAISPSAKKSYLAVVQRLNGRVESRESRVERKGNGQGRERGNREGGKE